MIARCITFWHLHRTKHNHIYNSKKKPSNQLIVLMLERRDIYNVCKCVAYNVQKSIAIMIMIIEGIVRQNHKQTLRVAEFCWCVLKWRLPRKYIIYFKRLQTQNSKQFSYRSFAWSVELQVSTIPNYIYLTLASVTCYMFFDLGM